MIEHVRVCCPPPRLVIAGMECWKRALAEGRDWAAEDLAAALVGLGGGPCGIDDIAQSLPAGCLAPLLQHCAWEDVHEVGGHDGWKRERQDAAPQSMQSTTGFESAPVQ